MTLLEEDSFSGVTNSNDGFTQRQMVIRKMPAYHEHAVGPPVGCSTMSLAVDHLRRHVLHRATERERLFLVEYRLLAQSKVCEFYVAARVQQYAAAATNTEQVVRTLKVSVTSLQQMHLKKIL